MSRDLISPKTRQVFRESMVGWVLREIRDEFDAARIDCDLNYRPNVSGQRRTLIEQYYHTVNWSHSADIGRVISVFETAILRAEKAVDDTGLGPEWQRQRKEELEKLIFFLKRDGLEWRGDRIVPIGNPNAAQAIGTGPARNEQTITEVTRRNIADAFLLNKVNWAGRFEEQEFLARLYNLQAMPSDDHRFSNASEDIWKHRTMNSDWEDHWVFYDRRFNLLHGADEDYLRFLCEILHPAVRRDADEVEQIRGFINESLANDDWELREQHKLSGRPIFKATRLIRDESSVGTPIVTANHTTFSTHPQIFISYAQPNTGQARAIAKFLQSAGFKTWMDKENLVAGEEWETVIRREINNSALVVICLSPQAADRKGYFHKEMRVAIEVAQRLPQGKIYIVPVRLGYCEIPDALQHIHVIDLHEPDDSFRLLASVGKAINEAAQTTDDEHLKLMRALAGNQAASSRA